MNQLKLLEKLKNKLVSMPQTEEGIIFVLVGIRKILELNEYPERYQLLRFYCDLAFHPRIDRKMPPVVKDMLAKVAEGKSYDKTIVGFSDLHDQLKTFLKEFELPDFYIESTSEQRKTLYDILLDVYDDIPIKTNYLGIDYEVKVSKEATSLGTISFFPVID